MMMLDALSSTPGIALFKKVTIQQWKYGSSGIKPTTLFYSNCRFPDALEQRRLLEPTRPQGYLIGKDADGTYCTSAAKEYPPALNRSFAVALKDVLRSNATTAFTAANEPFGHELAGFALSTEYDCIQPDYQPL